MAKGSVNNSMYVDIVRSDDEKDVDFKNNLDIQYPTCMFLFESIHVYKH